MSAGGGVDRFGPASFRTKLLVAMMLIVSAITALALSLAERDAAQNVEQGLQREFRDGLAVMHNAQEMRQAALVERCRALVRRPRIHAALEDNALDLLYPSGKDELRDLMRDAEETGGEEATYALHARFYRFLDLHGAVIPPTGAPEAGPLSPAEEEQIALPSAPGKHQLGYLTKGGKGSVDIVSEVIAMPIISSETNEPIAAIVLGFKPLEWVGPAGDATIKRGLWLAHKLHLSMLADSVSAAVGSEIARAIKERDRTESSFRMEIAGAAHLVFYRCLNPDSPFPPAYEVCIYPLNTLRARQWQLRWQVLGSGVLLLLTGLGASRFVSIRLARPVEKLAADSEVNRTQRERAEAALETTSKELQRSARFSADASHQLKTPVTVLRAGLEELLLREHLTAEECQDICALVHQTYRLTSLIEDLLLLSRMDAGQLQLEISPVDLSRLIEAEIDDLSALPDAMDLQVETDFPPGLYVAGEKRFTTIILQNLLENARKYNRRAGRIRIAARESDGWAYLLIGNTGRVISSAAQEHIFERFHRGSVGENVPGHGLGLNLARELARNHQGDLKLIRSENDWTEFEVRFHSVLPNSASSGFT